MAQILICEFSIGSGLKMLYMNFVWVTYKRLFYRNLACGVILKYLSHGIPDIQKNVLLKVFQKYQVKWLEEFLVKFRFKLMY